ncbi:MAG: M48 family metalloprotease [Desulfobacterales bacterium]|nr:M48 family metalloprotease [Desulfobacterales bacterium]
MRFPLENIFVMDGSRRSTKSNAFFTGFGRYRRAALFDTLISSHSTSELLAVFAHEVGHFKAATSPFRWWWALCRPGPIFSCSPEWFPSESCFTPSASSSPRYTRAWCSSFSSVAARFPAGRGAQRMVARGASVRRTGSR